MILCGYETERSLYWLAIQYSTIQCENDPHPLHGIVNKTTRRNDGPFPLRCVAFCLHPTFLDAALHCTASLLTNRNNKKPARSSRWNVRYGACAYCPGCAPLRSVLRTYPSTCTVCTTRIRSIEANTTSGSTARRPPESQSAMHTSFIPMWFCYV